jgi:hypothetical protein
MSAYIPEKGDFITLSFDPQQFIIYANQELDLVSENTGSFFVFFASAWRSLRLEKLFNRKAR